jgi:hypothetical protein
MIRACGINIGGVSVQHGSSQVGRDSRYLNWPLAAGRHTQEWIPRKLSFSLLLKT